MVRHPAHSTDFKHQVALDYMAGETLHSLARRRDLSRILIRISVQKHEAGAFDDEAVAADAIDAYEARIAALKRLGGKQALEMEFLKGASKHGPGREARVHSSSPAPLHLCRRRMPADGNCAFDLRRQAAHQHRRHRARRDDGRYLRKLRGVWLPAYACGLASPWPCRGSQEDPTPDAGTMICSPSGGNPIDNATAKRFK